MNTTYNNICALCNLYMTWYEGSIDELLSEDEYDALNYLMKYSKFSKTICAKFIALYDKWGGNDEIGAAEYIFNHWN